MMTMKAKEGLLILLIFSVMLITGCGPPQYTVNTSVSPEDSGTVSPTSGTKYEEGTEVILVAEPTSGYRFDHWSGDTTSTSATTSVIVDIDKNVTAHFIAQYVLGSSINPANTGAVSPASGTYCDDGSRVTITAEAALGYQFDHWSGDLSGTSNPASIVMDGDKSVVAHFTPQYVLSSSVTPVEGGTIEPAGDSYHNNGDEVTLTAKYAPNYIFDHWSGDVIGTDTTVTIIMDGNKSATAHFKMPFSPILSEVCRDMGVSQAADYQGDIHPVMLLDSMGNEHEWSDELPIEWLPATVEETQLVVCVGEEWERKIETCQYDGPDIERYQYNLDVTLREAKTGKVVKSTTLTGTKPRQCQMTEDYWLTRLEGEHVSLEQLEEWLQQYVIE